ncbi:hypothetical protein [Serratia ficaria]|uniref:hypothetical protein n=1 Tax=Serratia ficaria TaxID=61651 RepID=UPI0021C7DD37|nr:hypothetical protein [Serratia ficaria]
MSILKQILLTAIITVLTSLVVIPRYIESQRTVGEKNFELHNKEEVKDKFKAFLERTSYLDDGALEYMNALGQVQGEIVHAADIIARKQAEVCGKKLSANEVKNFISNDNTMSYTLTGILEGDVNSPHADYQKKVNDMKCLTIKSEG